MSSEIIIITGPTLSGKTFLANALMKQYCNAAKIWDEPIVNKKFFKEIKLFCAYHGRAIITCVDALPVMEMLKVDRIISLIHNV